MELSPEERRKIYEEEKARLEAREQLEQERQRMSPKTTTGITPNIAGVLCYVLGWITGIIFLVLERKNKWVRFHAIQSIIVFGALSIALGVLGWIPFIGWFFSAVIWIAGVVLWIVLMVKAYNGEHYKVPWAGEIAEKIVSPSGTIPDYPRPTAPPAWKETPPPPPPPPPPSAGIGLEERINKRIDEHLRHRDRREWRATASAFAIAWSIVLLIFFNLFYQYAAYYTYDAELGTWSRASFFTSDINLWLPIFNATLAISIVSHIVMIILDRDILRQALHVIIDGFGLATVITLLVVFPFDFSVIPNTVAAAGTHTGVTVVLICIAVGFGIGLLVRIIRLLISIVRAAIKSPEAA